MAQSSDDVAAIMSHLFNTVDSVRRSALSDFTLQSTPSSYTAHLDVPGFHRSELNVTIDERYISVSGEHRCGGESGKERAEKLDRSWLDIVGTADVPCVERVIDAELTLPTDAIASSVKAHLLNGVLLITASRSKSPSLRHIPIVETVYDTASRAYETVQEGVGGMFDTARGTAEGAYEYGKRSVEDVVDGVRGAAERVVGMGASGTESAKSAAAAATDYARATAQAGYDSARDATRMAASMADRATESVKSAGAAATNAGARATESVKAGARGAADYVRGSADDAAAQASAYSKGASDHARAATRSAGAATGEGTGAAKHAAEAVYDAAGGVYEKIKEKVMGTAAVGADRAEL